MTRLADSREDHVHTRPVLPAFTSGAALTLGVALLALTACATPATPSGTAASPADDPAHGAIAGAAEMSEPQLHLTTVTPDGHVSQLDLLDETVAEIGAIDRPDAEAPPAGVAPGDTVTTDGRYLFAETADGVAVVDSGMWTWDHVDHFHYYRAEPRVLGTVEGAGPATVATTNSSTTGGTGVFFAGTDTAETSTAVLLDTAALSRGEVVETFRVEVDPHDGLVVPVGSFALVTDADGTVSVRTATGDTAPHVTVPHVTVPHVTATGETTDSATATSNTATSNTATSNTATGDTASGNTASSNTASGDTTDSATTDSAAASGDTVDCLDPRGTITTRVGAVLGCRDGALLATVVDGAVAIERIPLPDGAGPVASFANREGRPTAAGLDESGRILLLDTRERRWTVLDAPAPLHQVTAVDDAQQHVLALAEDGRVLVIDGTSGALLAATEPLLPETLAAATLDTVSLVADDQRAYLNAPAERLLYEIDYADAARIARVFETDGEPAHLALTGR